MIYLDVKIAASKTLFKICIETVQFSSEFSLFFRNTLYNFLYNFTTILFYRHVTTTWAKRRLSPWERTYIKKLAENYIFKNLNDSDTFSVPNSKNLNNSKNCYETNQIHFHLKGNRWLETSFINAAEARPGSLKHVRWASVWSL